MNQENHLEPTKPTNKQKHQKLWKTIKPHLTIFSIWFLFTLPLNFITTIGLYYQLISPVSYSMMVTILCLIVVNTIISAFIYFLITIIKRKFQKK